VSWLREAEPVRVDVDGPRGAVLRQPRKPGQLCTLEAVARALEVLESAQLANAMLDVLDELVARALARRNGEVAAR
jgi:DTW domain-containing protein YfiP